MARMVTPPGCSRTTAGAAGRALPGGGDSAADMVCFPLRLTIMGCSAHYYGRGGPFLSMGIGGDSACLLARSGSPAVGGRRKRTDVFDRPCQRGAQRFRVVGEKGDQGATLMSGNK